MAHMRGLIIQGEATVMREGVLEPVEVENSFGNSQF